MICSTKYEPAIIKWSNCNFDDFVFFATFGHIMMLSTWWPMEAVRFK